MIDRALLERLLDTRPVARLAQIDHAGDPQALPFVFARVDDSLWSPIDGKPKKHPRLSRLEWIERSPRVCVLIDDYASDWSTLWWLKIYGDAAVVRGGHPSWVRACAALRSKYPQYETTPMFLGDPVMIRIDIARWRGWAAAGTAAIERALDAGGASGR